LSWLTPAGLAQTVGEEYVFSAHYELDPMAMHPLHKYRLRLDIEFEVKEEGFGSLGILGFPLSCETSSAGSPSVFVIEHSSSMTILAQTVLAPQTERIGTLEPGKYTVHFMANSPVECAVVGAKIKFVVGDDPFTPPPPPPPPPVHIIPVTSEFDLITRHITYTNGTGVEYVVPYKEPAQESLVGGIVCYDRAITDLSATRNQHTSNPESVPVQVYEDLQRPGERLAHCYRSEPFHLSKYNGEIIKFDFPGAHRQTWFKTSWVRDPVDEHLVVPTQGDNLLYGALHLEAGRFTKESETFYACLNTRLPIRTATLMGPDGTESAVGIAPFGRYCHKMTRASFTDVGDWQLILHFDGEELNFPITVEN
jgi:hypothetical protein